MYNRTSTIKKVVFRFHSWILCKELYTESTDTREREKTVPFRCLRCENDRLTKPELLLIFLMNIYWNYGNLSWCRKGKNGQKKVIGFFVLSFDQLEFHCLFLFEKLFENSTKQVPSADIFPEVQMIKNEQTKNGI